MSHKDKAEGKKSPPWGLLLAIITLTLVPIVLHQIDFGAENVKMAGRICAAAALVLLVVGLIKNMVKIFALILVALIVVMILDSEGVIDISQIFSR